MDGVGEEIRIGPVLREASQIFTRWWVVVVIAGCCVGVGCVVLIVAMGRCLTARACVPNDAFEIALQNFDLIRRTGDLIVGWLVLTCAQSTIGFFELRGLGGGNAGRTIRRVLVRSLMCMIISAVPAWVVGPIYRYATALMPADASALLWTAYVLRRLVLTGAFSYIDARFALYLPSSVNPKQTFLETIAQSQGVWRRFFWICLPMEGGFGIANSAIDQVCRRWVDLMPLATLISRAAHVPDTYVLTTLPLIAGFTVATTGSALFFVAIAIVLRRDVDAVTGSASVFD